MISRGLGRWLAVATVLASSLERVQSTFFSGPSCVLNCVGYADCGFNSPRCMCKAAQGNFLDQVLDCMSRHCSPGDLGNADQEFLDAMQILCSGIEHPIPTSAIAAAQSVASSLLSKAGAPTAAPTVADSPPPPPTASSNGPDGAAPTSDSGSGSATSEPDSPVTPITSSQITAGPGPASTSDSRPKTTGDAASSSEAAAKSAAESPTSTTAAVNHDPTDSSPFATPNAAGPRQVALHALAAVPFAALLAL